MIKHLAKDRLDVAGVVADAAHSYRRDVPEIVIVDFGDRNVEVSSRSVEEAAKNLALVFEREAPFEAEVQFEGSYDHYVVESEAYAPIALRAPIRLRSGQAFPLLRGGRLLGNLHAMSTLDEAIARELPEIIEIRHDLHMHPEIMYEEKRTSEVVQRELKKAGIDFKAGLAGGTGVLGWLPATANSGDAETIALRADMDALPIHEETGKPYASKTPGKMHACGHDGHTSILIGVARVLAKTKDRPNNILFLFQPAEEGGAGGKRMCEDGVLGGKVLGKQADIIFGLHGFTNLDVGQMTTRTGAMMASTNDVHITVEGKGGHAAAPHTGVDPIVVAAHIVTALQSIASRNVDPLDSIVVTIAQINAGTAHNIIPMHAELKGTLRTLKPETKELGKRRIKEIAEGVASAFGANAKVEIREGYPVTANEPCATDRFRGIARKVFGEGLCEDCQPVMGGEDFSYYGAHCPACFYFIGVRPKGMEKYPNLHAPDFDFSDDTLPVGMKAMLSLALSQ